MEWHAEWTKAQQDLSAASRNYQWWQTLPAERRRLFGRDGYRTKCKEAHLAVKVADKRCRSLVLSKRQMGGELGLRLQEAS